MIPVFAYILAKGTLRTILSMYVILLPALYRIRGFVAITAYYDPPTPPELISATTLLLFLFLAVAKLRGFKFRQPTQNFRTIESLLWGYSILSTISQFLNHSIWSAFWLSISGVWQYLIFFYFNLRGNLE